MLPRKKYLEALIKRMWNDQIKVITGIRRCGKSTLLFKLFKDYLLEAGVPEQNIITVALDDDRNESLRDPRNLSGYVRELVSDASQKYYVLLEGAVTL